MKNNNKSVFSDLITSLEFRDWVVKPNDERNYYWKKWMDAHPEYIADVKKAREFIERMTFKKEALSTSELDDIFTNILAKKNAQVRVKSSNRNINFYYLDQWVKVAAILIIFIISSVLIERFYGNSSEEPVNVIVEWKSVENPKGRKSKIFLPDGSIVNLNSNSQINYPIYFSESERLIELQGEAFFEVARDESRPFIVKTERVITEVLGTSFNINAFSDSENHYVAVVTGLVKVSNLKGEENLLSPNEMGFIDKNNNIDKTHFNIREITGWKDGIITFKRASFNEIQEQLSLWYGVDIIVDKGFKMDSVYTGEFINETLENVLDGIAFSSDFDYAIKNNKVIISKKKF